MVVLYLPLAVFAPAFYGVTRHEVYRNARHVQVALGSGDQSHVVRNLVARLDARGYEKLNLFLAERFGAELVRRTASIELESTLHLEVGYRDYNGELELSSAGAGLTSATALYTLLYYLRQSRLRTDRSALLLLDEPEAHLHPRMQGQVADALADAATELGVQTVLATHSVEVINHLGRRRDSTIASIDRRAASAVRVTSETEIVRALDEFCDLTPYSALSFLRSRRVVFYEGKSDWKILSSCARYLYGANDAKLRAWNEYVGISLDGVGNASAKGVLEKLLTPELFADRLVPPTPFRAVLIRDRDAERAWQRAELKTLRPHLESIDLVWSRYSIESLFLQPSMLATWLKGLPLQLPAKELERSLEAAIRAADEDASLNEQARGERMRVLARADREGNVNFRRAHEQASAEVGAAPEVWQNGRSRMRFVLRHLRAALPPAAAALVRTNLDDLLAAANVNLVGPGPSAIPAEIQDLFEAMLARSAPAPAAG
jgi:AAA domain, putative AbiEii toxin, Type IV TA system